MDHMRHKYSEEPYLVLMKMEAVDISKTNRPQRALLSIPKDGTMDLIKHAEL